VAPRNSRVRFLAANWWPKPREYQQSLKRAPGEVFSRCSFLCQGQLQQPPQSRGPQSRRSQDAMSPTASAPRHRDFTPQWPQASARQSPQELHSRRHERRFRFLEFSELGGRCEELLKGPLLAEIALSRKSSAASWHSRNRLRLVRPAMKIPSSKIMRLRN